MKSFLQRINVTISKSKAFFLCVFTMSSCRDKENMLHFSVHILSQIFLLCLISIQKEEEEAEVSEFFRDKQVT